MLVETLRSRTNAASISTVLDVAMPARNTTSSREPNTMYGLRLPHLLTVKSLR